MLADGCGRLLNCLILAGMQLMKKTAEQLNLTGSNKTVCNKITSNSLSRQISSEGEIISYQEY